jgi:hypothetical protein
MKIIRYLHHFGKVYNVPRQWYAWLRKYLAQWCGDMAKAKKVSKLPRRKRVTFYIRPKGSKRRKKVSFLIRG